MAELGGTEAEDTDRRPQAAQDLTSIKHSFDEYHKRLARLNPIVKDTLKHFKSVSDELFQNDKELLSEAEEEFITSALELRRKPVAFIVGFMNSGKSTMLNEILQKKKLVPTSDRRCTARIVQFDFAKTIDEQTWQFVDKNNRPSPQMPEKKKFKNSLPKKVIDLQSKDTELKSGGANPREQEEEVQQIVQAYVHSDILSYGFRLIDSPGEGENPALDKLIGMHIKESVEPLIIYLIDGNQTFKISDYKFLKKIKGDHPEAALMFVVTKIDPDETAMKNDEFSDGEEETGATAGPSREGGLHRVVELEERVMDKLKKYGFLAEKEQFGTSEHFHFLSARKYTKARLAGRLNDPDNQYISLFERFQLCFLVNMHGQMKKLEDQIVCNVLNLQRNFLKIFGERRFGVIAALEKVEDFIKQAKTAECHLTTEFMKYIEDIITSEDMSVVRGALNLTREEMVAFRTNDGDCFRTLSTEERESLNGHIMKLFELDELTERTDLTKIREKGAYFVTRIFNKILSTVPQKIIDAFDNGMKSRRDRFSVHIKKVRATLDDRCFTGLFEQAYGGRNVECGEIQKIIKLDPIKDVAHSTLYRFVDRKFRNLTSQQMKVPELDRNFELWSRNFLENLSNLLNADELGHELVYNCRQKMEEMHKKFQRNVERMSKLQEKVSKLAVENLQVLAARVRPALYLYLCEVNAILYEQRLGRKIEPGEQITKDDSDARTLYSRTGSPSESQEASSDLGNGLYTQHEYPRDPTLMVHVLKKSSFKGDKGTVQKGWMKAAIDIYHAHDIMEQTNISSAGKPHPYREYLKNCHGLWMPDRETFHVLFDNTDMTLVDYVLSRKLNLKARLQLALKVGRGLQLIHDVDYVHQDLRPTNVLMRGDTPKIHICRPQSPMEEVKLASGRRVPPFHLHPDYRDCHERTEASPYLDCYSFGTFLWIMCDGTFSAYPRTFEPYDKYSDLCVAMKKGVIPEEPCGQMENEREQHRQKLYNLMKTLWDTQDMRRPTMPIVNNHLNALVGGTSTEEFFHYFNRDNET